MYQQWPTVYQHDNYTEIKRTQARTTRHITHYAYIYLSISNGLDVEKSS